MDSVVQSWSTSQLVECLAALADQSDEVGAVRTAVERVLEALDAEIGIAFDAEAEPIVAVGLSPDDKGHADLLAAATSGAECADLADLGPCRIATVALSSCEDSMRLLVARAGPADFLPEEMLLLRGMAWVLDLALRQLRVVSILNERQRVLEHLSRVQRALASRMALPEVFDTVTESALSLVGSELAILHLMERDKPAVASISVAGSDDPPSPEAIGLSRQVARQVYRRDDLVRQDDRARPPADGTASAQPDRDELCSRAVMGAPVRENGAVVGSLVVMSHRGRQAAFPEAQVQALLTFADQVSVALSDAKTLATAQHALRDQVTGLPNRVLFLDRLEQALARGHHVHVLFLDLDRFKLVNDTLGHAAGDELLRQVGRRLRQALGAEEGLARFGGDEYAVLLENATPAEVERCGERMLDAVREAYHVGPEEVVVGGSIGVADGDEHAGASEILRNADTAMYRAKHAGGDRIVRFEQVMHTALVRRRSTEADLRRAVDANALDVVFQPIVGLRDERLHAAEALARWRHPTRGIIGPNEFIPLAEETGLIVPLGRQVLAAACAEAVTWPSPADAPRSLSVTVNVSARQLLDRSFMEDVRQILADSGLDPGRLVLEITESTIISDLDAVLDVMRRVRELGVGLAIDDFGTGYSSLSYLRMLPVEILKIDRSFVESIAAPWQGKAFVRAIVRLAETLSLTTIAEGVETPEQVSALLDSGCEIGQGFLFAPPMRPTEFLAYAARAGRTYPSLDVKPILAGSGSSGHYSPGHHD